MNRATAGGCMKVLLWTAIALASAVPAAAWQTDPETDTMKIIERVGVLEEELRSDDLPRRDAAEKELLAIGPVALDFLSPVGGEMSSDLQQRLGRVRIELERIAVEAVSRPSRLTLAGRRTVAEILAAIAKQTGNEVVLSERNFEDRSSLSIDTDWDNAEFWTVLADLEKRSELRVDPYLGTTGQLALSDFSIGAADRRRPTLPCSGSSSILSFAVTHAHASRNFSDPQANEMMLFVRLRWEPRLRPIDLKLPMSGVTIIDEFDKQHPVTSPDVVIGTNIQPEVSESDMYIPLPLLDRQIETIQSLKGTFEMTVPGRVETFQFDAISQLAAGTRQTRAGATVTFEGTGDNLDLKAVKLSLGFDQPHGAMESHMGWALNNEVWLQLPDGSTVKPIGTETWQQAEHLLGVSYLFETIPAGANLVYRTPAAIVKLKVPFELIRIPLP